MLANLLKLLFGNPSAPQENSNKQPLNADEAEDVAEKKALLARMKPDGEHFASKHANTPSQPPENITAPQVTQTAPLENSASKNDAPPQIAQPEQPLNKSEVNVAPQTEHPPAHKDRVSKVETTVDTATFFYEAIKKVIVDEKGLHVETAIITAARLSGSLLYRSVPMETNQKYKEPGIMFLDPKIDVVRKPMEGLLTTTLSTLGIRLDEMAIRALMSKTSPNEMLDRSRFSFLETMEKIQPISLSFCEITDDYRQAAAAAIITTAMFIKDASALIDVNEAMFMAMSGVIQGSKTVPPPANTKDEKIHAEKECDPINRFKHDAEQIYYLVKDYLSLNGGFDLPSLFCALGALAGQSCLQRALTLYEPPENIHSAQALLAEGSLVPIGTENGQELFFGNLLNQPLYESKYSVWNAIHSYLKQLDRQWDLDVNEIFDYVVRSGGKDKFGMLRVPMPYMPRELPIFYLKQLWPKTTEALGKISTNKTDWPFILSGALLHAIDTHKQGSNKLHPALIAKIVMESAVPMSKVPIEPNIALGNYIVNRQPIH